MESPVWDVSQSHQSHLQIVVQTHPFVRYCEELKNQLARSLQVIDCSLRSFIIICSIQVRHGLPFQKFEPYYAFISRSVSESNVTLKQLLQLQQPLIVFELSTNSSDIKSQDRKTPY